MGTFLVAYSLAVSARGRRKELAILRALGLSSRRVGRVLAAESLVLVGLMLVIGVPAGLLAGAAAWRPVVQSLGFSTFVVIPPTLMVLLPLALAVAVAASIMPARRARREPVAVPLRAE
jgi:putative ABC transport system permease protein